MARVTIEDCLEHVSDHFALIHLAAKRFRQLQQNAAPAVESKNKPAVTALREIASGQVRFREDLAEHMRVQIELNKLKAHSSGNSDAGDLD
jgi:DNA-directed RNA polymerase subunit omega